MRRSMVLAFALMLFVACGSSGDGNETGGDDLPQNEVLQLDLSYDGPAEDVPLPPEDGVLPQDDTIDPDAIATTKRIEFLVDTSLPIAVPNKQTYTIRARIVDTATGEGVKNTAVTFKIVKVTEGLGGEELVEFEGSMTTGAGITDETGRVDGVFQAGEASGQVYTIELASKDIPSVRMDLIIDANMVCAKLQVGVTYEGTLSAAASYVVSVLPGDTKCADITAGSLPAPVTEAVGTDFATGVEVPCVPPNKTFTVFVTAKENCPFASGCTEGVASLAKDTITEATVALGGVDVSLDGTYTGTHRFNLADLFPDCTDLVTPAECATPAGLSFPKVGCCYLDAIEGFFKTDAAGFATAIKAASASLGGKIPAGKEADFGAAVDAAMTEFLAANTPEWVAGYADVSKFVHLSIRNVNLTSTLKLDPAVDGENAGTQTWTAFTIFWKSACDPTDTANYATCGKCTYLNDRFGGLSYTPTVPGGTFKARVGVGNLLELLEHEIALNPGRLLAFTVNDVAANALTGGKIRDSIYKDGLAKNVGEAAKVWMNCASIAPVLLAKAGSSFTGTQQDLQTLCTTAVDKLLEPQMALLTAVAAPSKLTISGKASWTDTNCDLKSDRFQSSEYTGAFVPGSGASIPITGSFSANRN